MEEAQDNNAFDSLNNQIEDNYLELETEIKVKEKNQPQKCTHDHEDEEMDGFSKSKPFNAVGIRNLINLHDHITCMIKEKQKHDDSVWA